MYFAETFLENLHAVFNGNIKSLILPLLRDCPRDQPLPLHFAPAQILNYICARVRSIGITNMTATSTPSSLTTSSPRRSAPSAPTRQITGEYVDVRLLDDIPEDIYVSVCSLVASATSNACDLCAQTDHLVASCPLLHKVIRDPVKTRRILSVLTGSRSSRGGPSNSGRPSPSRPRTPPASNRTATMRALRLDEDEATDEDATVAQLTDVETDGENTDHESDFP